jgi:arsenite methyltransferase
MTTQTAEEVRSSVATHYSEAIAEQQKTACCGGGKAKAADQLSLAGYSEKEFAGLPNSAVSSSFGCGNPVAFSGVKPGDIVLDLGSGAGLDLLLAARAVGSTGRVIGVDMTDEMIARARENIRAANVQNVEVRKGIIEALPVDDASVDWIISNCVINLSPEKGKVFSEIARALKPGGQMLVSDIVANDIPRELMAEAAAYVSCVTGALSEEQFIAGLKTAGLRDVAVRDRIVYDTTQIKASLADVLTSGAVTPSQIEEIAARVTGKVWSAEFYGRKPAGTEAQHA